MPVKTIATPSLLAAGDHFFIAHRASWLDDSCRAGGSDGFQAIGKGEEGVRRSTAVGEGQDGFHGAEFGSVDTAHLPGTDAESLAIARIDDGIRLHMLADAPREDQVGEFGIRRLAFGDDLKLRRRDVASVSILLKAVHRRPA